MAPSHIAEMLTGVRTGGALNPESNICPPRSWTQYYEDLRKQLGKYGTSIPTNQVRQHLWGSLAADARAFSLSSRKGAFEMAALTSTLGTAPCLATGHWWWNPQGLWQWTASLCWAEHECWWPAPPDSKQRRTQCTLTHPAHAGVHYTHAHQWCVCAQSWAWVTHVIGRRKVGVAVHGSAACATTGVQPGPKHCTPCQFALLTHAACWVCAGSKRYGSLGQSQRGVATSQNLDDFFEQARDSFSSEAKSTRFLFLLECFALASLGVPRPHVMHDVDMDWRLTMLEGIFLAPTRGLACRMARVLKHKQAMMLSLTTKAAHGQKARYCSLVAFWGEECLLPKQRSAECRSSHLVAHQHSSLNLDQCAGRSCRPDDGGSS